MLWLWRFCWGNCCKRCWIAWRWWCRSIIFLRGSWRWFQVSCTCDLFFPCRCSHPLQQCSINNSWTITESLSKGSSIHPATKAFWFMTTTNDGCAQRMSLAKFVVNLFQLGPNRLNSGSLTWISRFFIISHRKCHEALPATEGRMVRENWNNCPIGCNANFAKRRISPWSGELSWKLSEWPSPWMAGSVPFPPWCFCPSIAVTLEKLEYQGRRRHL